MDLRDTSLCNMDRVTKKMIVILVIALMRRHEGIYADYREECEAARRRRERPRTCEHGMYLWVDYDPICGPCEDGHSLRNPQHRRQLALAEAKERVAKSKQMFDLIKTANELGLLDAVDIAKVAARSWELLKVENY